MPVETGPPSRNSESPLIPGLMDASRPPSDLLQGWHIFAEMFLFFMKSLQSNLCILFFFFFNSITQIVNGLSYIFTNVFSYIHIHIYVQYIRNMCMSFVFKYWNVCFIGCQNISYYQYVVFEVIFYIIPYSIYIIYYNITW